ncbi:MAG: ATP-binding cassette domain-containing protein [Desulfobacterales bacterium]
MIALTNICKRFGDLVVLDGVDFDVQQGETVALLGPSGTGKSVLLKQINGLIHPDSGLVEVDGLNVGLLRREQLSALRQRIGYVFQYGALFDSMTVLENIQIAMLSYHKRTKSLFKKAGNLYVDESMDLIRQVGIENQHDRACGVLAYGDLKRVELAVALVNKPKLLLMDEPTAGMGPSERQTLMELTKKIVRSQNIGILFTEHDMDVVFNHAEHIILLNRGELVAQGTPEEVRQNDKAQKIYLGSGKAVKHGN